MMGFHRQTRTASEGLSTSLLSETRAAVVTNVVEQQKGDTTSNSSTIITPPQRNRAELNRKRALVFQQEVSFGKFKHMKYSSGRLPDGMYVPRNSLLCFVIKCVYR